MLEALDWPETGLPAPQLYVTQTPIANAGAVGFAQPFIVISSGTLELLEPDEQRFVLTFTSSGASNAEMWLRDWAETWGHRVNLLDRTMSLGAINVTGPLAGELMRRAGVDEGGRLCREPPP